MTPQPEALTDAVTLYAGDALAVLAGLPAASVDAVVTDPPYGTTACEWDTAPPLAELWAAVRRVLAPGGCAVMTACQPFTSDLVTSNRRWFRCAWVWEKRNATGFLDANRRPLRAHEDVLVFAPKRPRYTPQFEPGEPYTTRRRARPGGVATIRDKKASGVARDTVSDGRRYPRSVIRFSNEKGLHPTQKPTDLIRYLVRTYTRPGDLVLDPFAGSGTTGVAAAAEGRRAVLVEQEPAYCDVIRTRLRGAAA